MSMHAGESFYGLYRGLVVNNLDPAGLGRLQLKIPQVYQDVVTGWARPCADYNSTIVPPNGTPIWVMFEAGSPEHPIWMGVALLQSKGWF